MVLERTGVLYRLGIFLDTGVPYIDRVLGILTGHGLQFVLMYRTLI